MSNAFCTSNKEPSANYSHYRLPRDQQGYWMEYTASTKHPINNTKINNVHVYGETWSKYNVVLLQIHRGIHRN